MKAMLSAFVAMILIAAAAGVVLEKSGFSAADHGLSSAVRLD